MSDTSGKHTEGPWVAAGSPDFNWIISPPLGSNIRPWFTVHVICEDDAEAEAIAHLIAAAPPLLDALRDICEFCDDPDGSEKPECLALGLARLLPAARSALRRASGQEG